MSDLPNPYMAEDNPDKHGAIAFDMNPGDAYRHGVDVGWAYGKATAFEEALTVDVLCPTCDGTTREPDPSPFSRGWTIKCRDCTDGRVRALVLGPIKEIKP